MQNIYNAHLFRAHFDAQNSFLEEYVEGLDS